MVAFIHPLTGSIMWASEERVNEYKAKGYKLMAFSSDKNKMETIKQKPKSKKKG